MKKILILLFCLIATNAYSACEKEDFLNFVNGDTGCVGLYAVDKPNKDKKKLVIILHGDWEKGIVGNKYYNFAHRISNNDTNTFLIARPGYSTQSGNKSDGGDKRGPDKGDNYQFKRDVKPVGIAIKNLKKHLKPKKIILIGHSGGAATTGIILGKFPGLIDDAVLVSCPCDIHPWRKHRAKQRNNKYEGRNIWKKSDSPHKNVKEIDKKTKVYVVVGKNDDNTLPKFSKAYHIQLINEKISSKLLIVDAEHYKIMSNSDLVNLTKELTN